VTTASLDCDVSVKLSIRVVVDRERGFVDAAGSAQGRPRS
jgi:hypothetical protein